MSVLSSAIYSGNTCIFRPFSVESDVEGKGEGWADKRNVYIWDKGNSIHSEELTGGDLKACVGDIHGPYVDCFLFPYGEAGGILKVPFIGPLPDKVVHLQWDNLGVKHFVAPIIKTCKALESVDLEFLVVSRSRINPTGPDIFGPDYEYASEGVGRRIEVANRIDLPPFGKAPRS